MTRLRVYEDVHFDEHSHVTDRWRMVFAVNTKAGADSYDTLAYLYRPSYQDRPHVRARVIDPQGNVTELDPKLAREDPTLKNGDQLQGAVPLPRLAVGSVVEEEVVTTDRDAISTAGASYAYRVGTAESTRVAFSAPASLKLRVALHGIAARPTHQTTGGTDTWSYAIGATVAPDLEANTPAELDLPAHAVATTIASWGTLAKALATRTDGQIAAGPVALPPEVPHSATVETARALLSWLQTRVTPDGVSLDAAPILPATPAATLKQGRADDLAFAQAYVALLRQAGINADVALIDEGPGRDVETDVPELDDFDHALVRARLDGHDAWIDPTVDALALPILPSNDRHRRALVLSPTTTALVDTPAIAPADNVLHTTRTYELAESGYARVTEVQHLGGVWDVWARTKRRDDAKSFETDNAEDLKSRLAAKAIDKFSTTDPNDVSHPFEITGVVTSERGYTKRSSAGLWLFPNDLTWVLPDIFVKAETPARVRPYEWSRPHVYEIEHRIIVPDGYAMPAIADRTRDLGTIKFTETQRVAGNVLTVTMRLDTGKSKLTAAEVDATRAAVLALADDNEHFVFPNVAHQLFEKGAWKDAIVEANRQISAHPKDGKRHAALAELLVQMGLGEAGRREARLAIQLQPNDAENHVMLGWALAHDLFGRPYGPGYDRAGARAELEKARKLDPKNLGAATELGNLLARDDRGRLFTRGADPKGCAAARAAANELDPSPEHTMELARAQVWAGDYAGVEKTVRAAKQSDELDGMMIAAVALRDGVPAAIRAADKLSTVAARKHALTAASSVMLVVRRYPEARDLFAELGIYGPGTAQGAVYDHIVASERPLDRKTPGGAVAEAELALIRQDHNPSGIWDAKTEAELDRQVQVTLAKTVQSAWTSDELYGDIMRSVLTSTVEGDKKVWRVELKSSTTEVMYAADDRGTIKIVSSAADARGAGRHALRLLAKNEVEAARRLLDWVAKDGKKSPLFEIVWGPNHAIDREAVELAAAVLSADSDRDHALPIVEKCAGAPPNGDIACLVMMDAMNNEHGAWDDSIAHLTTWLSAHPKNPAASRLLAESLVLAGRPKEAEPLLADIVAPYDTNLDVLRIEIAVAENDLPAAIKLAEADTKTGHALCDHFNKLAWLEMVAGIKLQDALVAAGEAVRLGSNAGTLHTKAVIEADLGDLRSALEDDHKALEDRPHRLPSSGDWYVLGRIAEQLGMRDDAIAAYHQVKPYKVTSSVLPESDVLAKRRLVALGKP